MNAAATSPTFLIHPTRFCDERGWSMETYNAERWGRLGVDAAFVQDNQSYSSRPGTVRGLHFQRPPHAQAKLVRCLRGRIFDVAVDLRRGSPTFGHWVGAVLDAEDGAQLYISAGFAHGFVTLAAECEVAYKVSAFYAAECDDGICWDDPTIGVDWGLGEGEAPILSDKDARLPLLSDFACDFPYDGRPLQALGPAHRGSVPCES
jgi:dTDP-4-dehydrorhamnose 3,5-epimerase